ncbi:ShlB/FhaC/HecB family hemolysin secretion/activation protein [Ramlibacter sp. PS3R-8]|uniref:ShlB/FhaC/HecB family hemolysin secretion/activation protein n=1 Tax=Ramlibacter sp. PS3R-8 TaxID=3133437 RepID=UPI0030B64ABE
MNRGLASSRHPRRALVVLLAAATGAINAQPTAPAPAPAPAPVQRAQPPMATAAPVAVFPIRGFRVEGDNPLGDAEALAVLQPYVRPDATLETLQQATAALEKVLRDQGFGLHRVALPPQELGTTVRLTVVKFVVGKVSIEGAKIYDEQNVRLTVPELREGESPNFKTLAIQTAIANENANKVVQVGLRESEEPDKIDATISVKELKPWNIALSANNSGTDATGEDRLTITGSHSNLWNLDHQFVGAYTTAVERTQDVRQVGLAYKVPLYAQGGVLGFSYTNSDIVGNFGTFNSTGAGETFGINYTIYLAPQGGLRSYVTLALDDKVFDASRINDATLAGASDRRSRPITLGYAARMETDTAVWGYGAELAANTGSGANNNLESYRSEDPRIEDVHWWAVRGSANYSAPFAQNWAWSVRALGQFSPKVLISGEQFGLGGQFSVRGTDVERPISGDSGISATFEVTTPEVAQGLRFFGFLDAGLTANNEPNAAKPATDRLASVGLGARWVVGKFAATLDYGRIVLGSHVPRSLNSASPKSGDDRLYVGVAVRF